MLTLKWETLYQKEKKEYLLQTIDDLTKMKTSQESEIEQKTTSFESEVMKLKQLISDLQSTGKNIDDLKERLDMVEGKKPNSCAFQMDDNQAHVLGQELQHLREKEEFKTNYEFYQGVIDEMTKNYDKSFNQLLLLTVSSQMPKEEQVKRINESFSEKNNKLLEYLSHLVLKNFLQNLNFLGSFVLNIKDVDQTELIHQIQGVRKSIESVKEWNLKEAIKLSKSMIDLQKSLKVN